MAAFVTAAVMLVLGASPALAGKGVVETFGELGTGAGQFAFPTGVAVNQATGDVYVADADCCSFTTGGQRVSQFGDDGTFVRAWGWGVETGAAAFEVCTTSCLAGIQGSGDGQFSIGSGDGLSWPQIAVDQSDGSVYVADNLNSRIQKFSSTGAFLGQFGGPGSGDGELGSPFGVAVDPVSGDVYVADTDNNRVQRFDSSGAYLSQFGVAGSADGELLGPYRVAVDSTGRVYVLDRGNGRVQRFTAAGSFDQVFAAGSVVAPSDLAIDPANDHVLIAGQTADQTVVGILEFDPAGAAVDVHAANAGVSLGGFAASVSTGQIYASSAFIPKAVLILDDVPAPTAEIAPVSDATGSSAVFHGSVNPQGAGTTRYRFEYSTDGTNWTAVPSDEGVLVASGSSDVEVSQPASGLAPNTEYRVRLVAFKDFNAGSATSSEVTFSTVTVAPAVRPLAAGNRTDTAAWLGGEVNPRNLPTTYYLEYTLADDATFANSSRIPVNDTVEVGDDNAFTIVSQLVTGLQPNTEYRFRVVAANAAGTTEGPDTTFTTRQAAPEPPPGRGYEMVSPADKNSAAIDRNLIAFVESTSGAAAGGNTVAYAAQGQFAGIPTGPAQAQYRSVRTDAGWTTRGISPPMVAEPVADYNVPSVWILSEDLSKTVVTANSLLTPDAPLLGGSWGLYLQDNSSAQSSYRLLSAPAAALPPEPPLSRDSMNKLRFGFNGGSSDLDHIVFRSDGRQLTADGPESGPGLYEWSDGQIDFVSELPSGEPATTPVLGADDREGQFYPGDHAVSEDGQRVFFTDGSGTLYVREAGSVTKALSVSERTGEPATPQVSSFQAATADDGSQALFTSPIKLTDDATATASDCTGSASQCHADLYLWNAAAPEGQRLTDLTTADPGGGGVVGIAAASDDLSLVYFVASGALTDEALEGRPNLYLWSPAEGVRYVTTLDEQDGGVWSTGRNRSEQAYRDARLSEDGHRLLFASRARVTAANNGGHKQLYLYDADSKRLVCTSCIGGDGAATGPAWLFYPPDLGQSPTTPLPRVPYRLPRNLSADGERVFFETAEALVDSDTNGKADVYMWSGGELRLVSSGKSDEESEFIDASESGDDVFFTTRERLVWSDVDDLVDVYDARVGGGFPEQKVPQECVGDTCQPSTPRPVLSGPGSMLEAGDPPLFKRPSFTVSRLSAGLGVRSPAGVERSSWFG